MKITFDKSLEDIKIANNALANKHICSMRRSTRNDELCLIGTLE